MTIYFIGVHNKPGLKPLDSSTKTGKIVDRIIELLIDQPEHRMGFTCIKTNLFDIEYLPDSEDERFGRATMLWQRFKIEPDDILVLLGNTVQKEFVNCPLHERIIKVRHPAALYSKEIQFMYRGDVFAKIWELMY
jgi:hypothetical protein